MNPQEPVIPDPDEPNETPMSPVEEPPTTDGADVYEVGSARSR